ncbi:Crp/Fnr family transcriptional regulator [Chitinophaga tropicalis]|uniref:Cyclic nucleotide-binding domain-containing protein n=1 Tax=Chitinophaga tropicalis TaxID=2683588 RepID=A0A7K1U422_9BACT|nr:Crp/Fnr family transcriptional regulator [Chitinophaga tropicalis]MVT09107.1 cyclic nucleotide-binding domain-containing protein [Chitinophaga tropicalis]
MFEAFENYMMSRADLTKDQLKYICSLATMKKLRRRHLLLKEGEVCQYKIFVSKGLLYTYRRKDDGTEYIMRFAPEDTWTIDHESYNNQTPSVYNIEALEDSEVMLWRRDEFEELATAIPTFKGLSDQLKANSLDISQQRILKNISYTSEEKYEDFITSYPDIFRRVPLHMVASFLGVSRETLSRIRHARLKQNNL